MLNCYISPRYSGHYNLLKQYFQNNKHGSPLKYEHKIFSSVCRLDTHDKPYDAIALPNFEQTIENSQAVFNSVLIPMCPGLAMCAQCSCFRTFGPHEI